MSNFYERFSGVVAPSERPEIQVATQLPEQEEPKKKVRVTRVYPNKEFVMLVLSDGRTTGWHYNEVLQWLRSELRMLQREDASKPKEELDREMWLIEDGVKACVAAARSDGKELSSKAVGLFLKMCEQNRKQIPRRAAVC